MPNEEGCSSGVSRQQPWARPLCIGAHGNRETGLTARIKHFMYQERAERGRMRGSAVVDQSPGIDGKQRLADAGVAQLAMLPPRD